MRQYLVEEELESYRFGWISRREFIRRAVLIGVGAATATAMARNVQPAQAAAQGTPQASPYHVDEGDPRVEADTIWYRSTDGKLIMAYVAWPAGASMDRSHPGVAVSHANQGLLPHHMDVARRFAVQGYVAVAPDQVSRSGSTAHDLSEDGRRAAYAALDPEQTARDMLAAIDVLKDHPAVDAWKLAATGYCAGGSITWRLATLSPDLKAAAPFYGSNPPLEEVPNIRAAMLGVYGGLDNNMNVNIPAIDAAMNAAGTIYKINVYPDSLHGFHDDTGNYNPVTGPEAWRDTLTWFAQYLGLPAPSL